MNAGDGRSGVNFEALADGLRAAVSDGAARKARCHEDN
jgi:hypothetical protein